MDFSFVPTLLNKRMGIFFGEMNGEERTVKLGEEKMKSIGKMKCFKILTGLLIVSFSLLPVPQVAFAQETPGTETSLIDPSKELVEISKEELDKLQEEIARIDDPALKSEILGVVAQEMQIVVIDPTGTQNTGGDQIGVDITTQEGQKQVIEQLNSNEGALLQNGVNQQTISALKEAIGVGDKGKVETLMSEMAQNMGSHMSGPMGDFDKGMPMPVFEMMKEFGFGGPMDMGQSGEMGRGAPAMEMVDFKDFYTGVRIEEMGVSMMEKSGFSQEQIEQFADKAKQEFFNHQGEGNFDPKVMFEGAFREIFAAGGPMMEGQGPMGPQGEFMGPNGPMEAMMGPGGPGGPGEFAFNGPQGEFNFTEFLDQNNHMMGEMAFMANEGFNHGPQGFEGFQGPGPGGFEFVGPGPQGFEGPQFGGYDPAGNFQGPGDVNFVEGFQPPEFQPPEFQPPSDLPPPPPEGQQQNNLNPPPELHHHDLGEIPHVQGDAHGCVPPACS